MAFIWMLSSGQYASLAVDSATNRRLSLPCRTAMVTCVVVAPVPHCSIVPRPSRRWMMSMSPVFTTDQSMSMRSTPRGSIVMFT